MTSLSVFSLFCFIICNKYINYCFVFNNGPVFVVLLSSVIFKVLILLLDVPVVAGRRVADFKF